MTVNVTTAKSGPYSGNGSTTEWPFDFKVFTADQIELIITETATGDETVVTSDDFSIPDTDLGTNDGGNVTYPTSGSPVASGYTVTVRRVMPMTQLIRSRNQGGQFPEVQEKVWDTLAMGLLQLKEEVDRSIKYQVADSATRTSEIPIDSIRAGKAVIFDANGNVTISTDDYEDQAADAAASAVAADASATAAATSETNAAASETAAAASAAAAAASAAGMKWRPSVRAATTANITLSGTQTIDGVSVIAGDRVLVKDQSTSADNGVYDVAAGAWTRSSDLDTWAELVSAAVIVEEGTTNKDTVWICTVDQGGTLGSTSVTWSSLTFSLADGSVTAAKLASDAVTTVKIGDNQVTLAKLATMAANTVLVNATSASAVPTALAIGASQLLGRGSAGNILAVTLGTGLSMSSTGALSASAGPTSGTATATTSGTAVQFTGIPSTAKRIIVSFAGVSLNSSSNLLLQIGPSGGVETSGYDSYTAVDVGGTNATVNSSAGHVVRNANAARAYTGHFFLTLLNASTNLWVISCIVYDNGTQNQMVGASQKTLAGTLERLRLTTVGGTDTFDAGSINIMYD